LKVFSETLVGVGSHVMVEALRCRVPNFRKLHGSNSKQFWRVFGEAKKEMGGIIASLQG
jgi:hypothetical protein